MKNSIKKALHESIKKLLFENFEDETRTEFKGLNNENMVEVDNFKEIKNLLNFSSPDDVYFIQLTKRTKDHPHDHMKDNEFYRYYLVHSYQEILDHESEIKALCIQHGFRAYITSNKRSLKDGMKWAAIYKADPHHYKHMIKHEIESAFGRSFPNELSRDVVMIDIDTDDKTVHDEVHKILQKYGIKIMMEYYSLNNGLHIFTKSQEEILDAILCNEFFKFDGGKDLGRLATVGVDFDVKAILYVCLEPKGYRAPSSYSPKVQAITQKGAVEMRKTLNDRYTALTGKVHK